MGCGAGRGRGRVLVLALGVGSVALAVAACTYDVPGVVVGDAAPTDDRARFDIDSGTGSDLDASADTSPTPPDAPPGDTFAAPPDAADAEAGPTDATVHNDAGDTGVGFPFQDGSIGCGSGIVCDQVQGAGCCATYVSTTPTYSCTAPSACPDTVILCDDSRTCGPGGVCCGIPIGDPLEAYGEVVCAPFGECPDGGTIFCDPAVAGECPGTTTCHQSAILPGFYVCQ